MYRKEKKEKLYWVERKGNFRFCSASLIVPPTSVCDLKKKNY